ncbi:MAG: hypothetical protein JSW27_20180 [Phycisphaerales bacterium]|nr:MAG: hypothetical protein JSW27_20180 [Phycisphaerales bacterium]
MLILRIKQAQCALADDRLDEAFEIAKADDVRRHRHGQRLIGRLTRAFVRRARQNLEAGRFQPALADCNKAEKLAGNASEVAGLREAVCQAMAQHQQGRQQEAFRVAQVRQNMADGWLSVGERILAGAPTDDGQAQLLREELAAARFQSEDAVAKAEQALKHGDIEMAVDLLRSAGVTKNRNGQVGQLLRQISRQAGEQARVSFEQGRIDRAQSLLQRLTPLGVDGEDVAELRRAVTQCHQAAECVAGGQPGLALPLLRQVKTMYPSAKWLDQAVAEVRQAAEAVEELEAGPLGLSIADAAGADDAGPWTEDRRRMTADRGQRVEEGHAPSSGLPSEFVMQMDGIGSYLVFRNSRVTVGPISSSRRPTLGLVADPNLPVISIERMDGDYFLRCERPVQVNGGAVTEKLLADGDAIALSPRCRLRFRLPNPASPTALLMLSGARLGRPDVRHVILMGRDILAGPYTNNHIQTEHLEETVTFFCQNDRLLCRAAKPVTIDDRPVQPEKGLTLDKPIRVGKLSMVLAKFHT